MAVAAVYMAQTHVLAPDNQYFKLVGNRPALLKVQLTGSGTAPQVVATLTSKGGVQTQFTLSGPTELSSSWEGEFGKVVHTFEDSWTMTVPAASIAPGLGIKVSAGNAAASFTPAVGAPSAIRMNMFDVHYFGWGSGDYPSGWEDELQQKWPVASLDVQRIRHLNFHELVIRARPDVGTKIVRVRSKEDYKIQTGQNFDGEQGAALEWVEALSAAGANFDHTMCYINIIGVAAGGQAGGFDGVGTISSLGVLNHELGHALSLPHWSGAQGYPYYGDLHGMTAPNNAAKASIGPAWAFDLATATFIPPTCIGGSRPGCGVGQTGVEVLKQSPMMGGGTGDEEPKFLFRHFSDHGVDKMRSYIESKLAVNVPGVGWRKWSDATGAYTSTFSFTEGVRMPLEEGVEVISVMAACCLANKSVSMVYPPIGPYTSNLIHRFDPRNPSDRQAAVTKGYCPSGGCDFSLKVIQAGVASTYMLAASGVEGADLFAMSSLMTRAVNVRASDGPVNKVQLLLTPDAHINGLIDTPEVLDEWPPNVPDCTSGPAFPADDDSVIYKGGASKIAGSAHFQSAEGEAVEWLVDNCATENGPYTITFDYFAGATDRPLKLLVDGVVLVARLCFPSTGGWNVLGTTAQTTVTLGTGVHTITLESIGYSGNNIQRLNLYTAAQAEALPATGTIESNCKDPGSFPQVSWATKALSGQHCASGTVIDNVDDCRAAAAEVGMPFNKQVGPSADRALGCFHDINGYVYFNRELDMSNILDTGICSCSGGLCLEKSRNCLNDGNCPKCNDRRTDEVCSEAGSGPIEDFFGHLCTDIDDNGQCKASECCRQCATCPPVGSCPSGCQDCKISENTCDSCGSAVCNDECKVCIAAECPHDCESGCTFTETTCFECGTATCNDNDGDDGNDDQSGGICNSCIHTRGRRPLSVLPPSLPPTPPSPPKKRLFLIAGQSNAEGNVALERLRTLVDGIPADVSSSEDRDAARLAVARSQGLGGCANDDVPHNPTADVVVNELLVSSIDWRAIDASWELPSVQMASVGFNHAGVTIHEQPTGLVEVCSYVVADSGKNCVQDAVTDTATGCMAAAVQFGKPFNKVTSPQTNRPAGCFWDPNGEFYFNPQTDVAAIVSVWGTAICKELCQDEEPPDDAVGDIINKPEACSANPDATLRNGPQLVEYTSEEYQHFRPLRAGHGANSDTFTTYGPELTFGQVLDAELPDDDQTFLLKVSMGGSSLLDHWRAGGPLRNELVSRTNAALLADPDLELAGLLWFQGYNDQFDGAYCTEGYHSYRENLDNLISDLRAQLAVAELPVVVVKIAKARTSSGDVKPSTAKDTIAAAQDTVAARDPKVGVVESWDTSLCYHYDSGAQLVIGERAAKRMLELL